MRNNIEYVGDKPILDVSYEEFVKRYNKGEVILWVDSCAEFITNKCLNDEAFCLLAKMKKRVYILPAKSNLQ